MSYLAVDEISINFGGLRAVDRVTFAIQEGQIHGLIGPNGAGKTTIFNCVTGFYHPTSGRIHFHDRDITHLRPDQIARLGIARTFQNVQLFRGYERARQYPGGHAQPHADRRPGRGAVALPFVHRQERLMREQGQEIMDFLGLAALQRAGRRQSAPGLAETPGARAGTGTGPKAAAAGRTRRGPEYLGNPGARPVTLRSLRDRFKLTILLVEHDMGLVMNICDTITVLNFGQKIAEGTPFEVQNDPEVIKAYLGETVGVEQP